MSMSNTGKMNVVMILKIQISKFIMLYKKDSTTLNFINLTQICRSENPAAQREMFFK